MRADSAVSTVTDQMFPLRLGGGDAFSHVASFLKSARFDEETLCRILGIPSMAEFGSVRPHEVDLAGADSPLLALLVRLFLFIEPVTGEEVARAIEPAVLRALLDLDLLRPYPAPGDSAAYCAPVLLYPVAGLLIASDRHENPDRSSFVPPADVVFPAIFAGTLRFLKILPTTSVEDVLDLCAGTGIGALALSRHVQRAVAADITGRATHFARFNCLLNRCANVEVAQGDLYQPVDGRTFDRIVAHPPYVPAASDTQIFRDAGQTGEAVLQPIIAGLPRFLRRGGAFYSMCGGWDAKDGPFEARVRHWLGAAHEEFDVLFAMHHEMSPADVARGLAEQAGAGDLSQVSHWRGLFGDAGVERRVYGALVLDRPGAGRRQPITRRLRLSSLTDGASFERLLRWLRWRDTMDARGELVPWLLQATLHLSPHLRMNVAYAPQPDGLGVTDVVLETDRPFAAMTRIDPWMFTLVARFDGQQTAAAIYESARSASQLPEGFGSEDFAGLVATMIERGYVDSDDRLLNE